MAQTTPHLTLTNLPPSNPDTPSEMPGTPTSTTTSLSALSTTAIKDGHRGHFPQGPLDRGHQHSSSLTSLEAERADRISRLAGLERVSTLRAPPLQHAASAGSGASTGGVVGGGGGGAAGPGSSSLSPQTTPTSTTNFPANFPASHPLTPAYFDNNGQPVAVTKLSTVGTASATESHIGEGDDNRTTAGERDEDMLSTGTNYREGGSVTSTAGEHDAMDEDMDRLGQGYDDRMSDDGSASLVGFGEGAGSTVSGPIYHRRPAPGSTAAAAAAANQSGMTFERTDSGLSDVRRDRDVYMSGGSGAGGVDTPLSAAAIQERRDARMMDGVAAEPPQPARAIDRDDNYVDTTLRGPLPVSAPAPVPGLSSTSTHEAAEQIVQRLDHGEARTGTSAGLSAPASGGDHLGQFYFEKNQ